MLMLLPPSEAKAMPRRGRPLDLATLSSPALAAARARVLDALVELCGGGHDPATPVQNGLLVERAAATLGVGHTQLDLVRHNAGLADAPTARADQLYTGVLYDALDVPSLSAPARRRIASRVAVTSALFGIVRPGDRIPAYRLSGDVTLPTLGPVAAHWREHLGPAVLDAVGTGLLVDLRSATYAAFWRPGPAEASRVVTVRVLHDRGGTRTVVSHVNKATKGRLVRAVLEDGGNPRTPAAFADQLRDLGWKVEDGEPARHGTRLDVVVREL